MSEGQSSIQPADRVPPKAGVWTSEFWHAVIAQIIAIASLFGVMLPVSVTNAVAAALGAVFVIVTNAVIVIHYIQGRVDLKKEAGKSLVIFLCLGVLCLVGPVTPVRAADPVRRTGYLFPRLHAACQPQQAAPQAQVIPVAPVVVTPPAQQQLGPAYDPAATAALQSLAMSHQQLVALLAARPQTPAGPAAQAQPQLLVIPPQQPVVVTPPAQTPAPVQTPAPAPQYFIVPGAPQQTLPIQQAPQQVLPIYQAPQQILPIQQPPQQTLPLQVPLQILPILGPVQQQLPVGGAQPQQTLPGTTKPSGVPLPGVDKPAQARPAAGFQRYAKWVVYQPTR